MKLSTELRRIRRLNTTRPDVSKPAWLQEFLPRSIPKTTISIGPLLYLSQRSAIIGGSLQEGRAIP
jgi:hypothetical protein